MENEQPTQPTVETDEQKEARLKTASEALTALLKEHRVSLNVSKLDISSGKIWPQIDLIALP